MSQRRPGNALESTNTFSAEFISLHGSQKNIFLVIVDTIIIQGNLTLQLLWFIPMKTLCIFLLRTSETMRDLNYCSIFTDCTSQPSQVEVTELQVEKQNVLLQYKINIPESFSITKILQKSPIPDCRWSSLYTFLMPLTKSFGYTRHSIIFLSFLLP